MLAIKCSKHGLYNGGRQPAEPCAACNVVHTLNTLTFHVPDLERVQPNTMPDLARASTPSLLAEIEKRIG
jgi:hypothetical protein